MEGIVKFVILTALQTKKQHVRIQIMLKEI